MAHRILKPGVVGIAIFVAMAVSFVPSGAVALPAGRHYEMVSDPYKGGYGVNRIEAAGPTGEEVAYDSLGAFAGATASRIGSGAGSTYLARREASGWSTAPLTVPAWVAPYSSPPILDLSSSLEYALFDAQFGPDAGAAQFESTETAFLLHPTGAPPAQDFEVAGELLKVPVDTTLRYSGASPDLSHIVIEPPEGLNLTPEAEGLQMFTSQYDLVARGGTYALKLIGLNNKGKPVDPNCRNVELGGSSMGNGGRGTTFNALADDGRQIYFWTCGGSSSSLQLFLRLNGERTLEISRPLDVSRKDGGCVGDSNGVPGEVPCQDAFARPSAEFAGASADGSTVYFMTSAALVGEDTDTERDLYVATVGCLASEPECTVAKREVTALKRVSHTVTAYEAANVRGVVTSSPSGSRIYFVAGGVLSGRNAEGNVPVSGADNLYVYNNVSGTVKFVTDLCSGDRRSGEYADLRCPADLASRNVSDEIMWTGGNGVEPEAQTAGDGHYLLFSSYGQLTNDDTDDSRDVYRYDDQAERLERISEGEAGYDANGNRDYEHAMSTNNDAGTTLVNPSMLNAFEQARLSSRAISEDGSTIVFSTEESLSPTAISGAVNAYEWHEGTVSLVSSGSAPVESVVLTPSGNDVFFTTPQSLLSQDSDQAADVYDARRGDAIPAAATAVHECSGEGCHRTFIAPTQLLIPESLSEPASKAFRDNPKTHSKTARKKKVAVTRHHRSQLDRHAHRRSKQTRTIKHRVR